jgi:hypothetical protein
MTGHVLSSTIRYKKTTAIVRGKSSMRLVLPAALSQRLMFASSRLNVVAAKIVCIVPTDKIVAVRKLSILTAAKK